MKEVTTVKVSEDFPVGFFHQALHIYLTKQQVVNRKLSCASNVLFVKLSSINVEKKKFVIEKLQETACNLPETAKSIVTSLEIEFSEQTVNELKEFDELQDGTYLSIDRMVPRNVQKFKPCVVATFIGKLDQN